MSLIEIGTITAENKHFHEGQVGEEREIPVWERDDAPPGSTAESLLVFERGQPVKVAGPTHYHHLADGRVLGGFSGGTHHSEAVTGADGKVTEKVTRIVAIHQG